MSTIAKPIDLAASRVEYDLLITGGIAGFIGGAMFGAMMSATSMMENVAAMVGMESIAIGWLVHFGISIFVAVLYVGLVSSSRLRQYATRPSTGAGLGVGYGLALWVVGVVFAMPLWLGITTPMSPVVPNLDWMSFVGHLIYGVFLGTLYPLLLTHEQASLGVSSSVSQSADAESDMCDDRSPTETAGERPTDLFLPAQLRTRLENDERLLALALTSTAVEQVLVEAIADEADIAPQQVPEFCGGEGLDRYVQTASLLGLFNEHSDLLQRIAAQRSRLVQRSPVEVRDELDDATEEDQVIRAAIDFVEDAAA